jgi:hypothetical protein
VHFLTPDFQDFIKGSTQIIAYSRFHFKFSIKILYDFRKYKSQEFDILNQDIERFFTLDLL